MAKAALLGLEATLYRRGQFLSAVARWASFVVALVALIVLAEAPHTQTGPAVAVMAGWAVFHAASLAWLHRRPRDRPVKVAHDVVDGVAVGLGAAFSGALLSPVWLLLYAHVVGVAVRGGLAYALAFGLMDAAIVEALAWATPGETPAGLHALALLLCAFMGGTTGSYLHDVKRRLAGANRELTAANEALSRTNQAQERARVEQEGSLARLRESDDRYRRLLDGIQDGVLVLQDARIVQANAVLADMVGRAPTDLAGRAFAELVPEGDRAGLLAHYAGWEQGGGDAASVEARLLGAGGAVLLVSVRAGAVEIGGRRAVVATVRDVTLQKRLERELEAQAARLVALNDLASAVNLSLRIEDIFEVAAEEASRLVAFDRLTIALREEDGAGLEVVDVGRDAPRRRLSLDDPDVANALCDTRAWMRAPGRPLPPGAEALVGGAALGAACVIPLRPADRPVGSMNLGRFQAHPFSPADLDTLESVARHVAIALENSRLFAEARRGLVRAREANRRLEELDRLRQQYLQNVSHEFRSPLTVIRGYAEHLAESTPLEEAAIRDVMRVVLESCDRVIDMVDTLIEVSRIEQGPPGSALHVQKVDLCEVVGGALEPLRAPARRKGVALEVDLPAEPVRLEGDAALLQQVVRKLADNALKYSAAGGRVCVRARAAGDDRVLEVEDSGAGIAPEHLPHIFDKFYMADGGLNRRAGGTGVGLYLVREIVRLHQGTVEVRSRPGRGSVFSVRLPREHLGQAQAARA